MNRTALYNTVARDFGYSDVSASPPAAITNRIYGYLNDRHRRLLSIPGTERLRMETGPAVTLVASTPTYALNMPIQKVLAVRDTTNDRLLGQRDLQWYRLVDPDPTTGTQEYWIPMGWTPALRDIGGSGLWAVSSSASDTDVNLNVETTDTNGSHTQTNVNTNGTSRIQLGTATNHQRLVRFSADAAAVGVLSLYDAAADGNLVSTIQLGRTNAQFVRIALWPTPAAADSILVDYTHYIRDFSTAYDEPQLPPDFHYLVALGAKIDEGTKKQDLDRVKRWEQEWFEGTRQLVNFLCNGPDTVIIPGEPDETGISNLGGAFEAGVW